MSSEKTMQKTGMVAIIGRPSVGKSTFLNTASGEKISITSPVPQTTRNAVRGIINTNWGQLIFIAYRRHSASRSSAMPLRMLIFSAGMSIWSKKLLCMKYQ